MRAIRGAAPCGGNKTYQRRVLGLAIGYLVTLILANWLTRHFALDGAAAMAVALLPAIPMIGIIVVIGRLILDEKDEYLRMLHVRQMLIATGFMLSVCSVWGFLESFDQVPHVPAYWAFIIWCAGLALGTLYNELKS
ncbi:hypothetical protein KY084_12675 [Stakelama sp. CBK3Z-3]|uniref:DUF805 domain-containing protein n=2 Tax=Stakelama flava TaxID=2860338 RepID=A0ABS6XQM6_9SPHN|nr:hypothetical protein [Stakelama flava]